MYPVPDWSYFAPDQYGYQRACVLFNGRASTDHSGHDVSVRREDRSSISPNPLADFGWCGLHHCFFFWRYPLRSSDGSPNLVASKFRPCAKTLQAIRASLLARAKAVEIAQELPPRWPAGISDRIMHMANIIAVIDVNQAPSVRGPYKKQEQVSAVL
jgi:hypothetical protein